MEVKEDNSQLFNQFEKLGDMMGDGMHHEPQGKWISREYNKLARLLLPDFAQREKQLRALKTESINAQMKNLLADKKCHCGGALVQKRSGAKVAYCTACNARYIAKPIHEGKR